MCDIVATYKGMAVALTDVSKFRRHPNNEMIDKLALVSGTSRSEYISTSLAW